MIIKSKEEEMFNVMLVLVHSCFFFLQSQKNYEAKREELQRERNEERHFLDMEREKVEAHRAKHQLAIKLSEKMEETTRMQLSRESHEIAKARDDFERRKQKQLEAMEDAEKNIEAKAESLVNEIWEGRAQLEEDKRVLEEQGKEKKAMLLDSREQLTPAARELLEKQLTEIEVDIKKIEEAQMLLDEQEQNVEKLIEEEFIVLEQGKIAGQKKLEEDWKQLLDIEAANLWFIEQEVTERNDALEKQRQNLESKEAKLRDFQREQSKSLEKLVEEKEALTSERQQLLATFQSEIGETEASIDDIKEEMKLLAENYLMDSSLVGELEEVRNNLKESANEGLRFEETEKEVRKKDQDRLEEIERNMAKEKQNLEALRQTDSLVDGRYQEEKEKLADALTVSKMPSFPLPFPPLSPSSFLLHYILIFQIIMSLPRNFNSICMIY